MATGPEETRKVGLRFSERMAGFLAEGETDFEQGERVGQERNNPCTFEVTVVIEDLEDFTKLGGRNARLTGNISGQRFGSNLPVRNGEFSLFRPDPATGKRHMTYSFGFTGNDGRDYFLYGYKVIHDDPHKTDLLEDMTRLFTRIHQGASTDGPLLGSGILHFRMQSLPSMLASFEVLHASSLVAQAKALSRFFSFCYGEIRETYLAKFSPFYHTEYENLVLGGELSSPEEGRRGFFFFSGVHGKDFPWGDGESFWDLGLIIQKEGGKWERYVLTDRVIEGLELDVKEGVYRYFGPIFQLLEGYQVFRSELQKTPLPGYLRRVQAEMEIRFDYEKYDPVDVPFSLVPHCPNLVPPDFGKHIREWLP
jgi:hypothetical protein